MAGYLIIAAVNILAYMWLRSLPNPEQADEMPKHRKLQMHSHELLTCYGVVGAVSSRMIFGIASDLMQLIMCVIMVMLLCAAVVLQVWAWQWFRKKQKNEMKGGSS